MKLRDRPISAREQAEINASRAEFDRFWWEEWVPRIHREEATKRWREQQMQKQEARRLHKDT
jgi:hypothetical protein